MKDKMVTINGDGSLIETEDILQSKHNNISSITTPRLLLKTKVVLTM